MAKAVNIQHHLLVPKHELLSEKEAEELLLAYNISQKQMPAISVKDPAISHLQAKPGMMVRIHRKSPTAGVAYFYRVVREL